MTDPDPMPSEVFRLFNARAAADAAGAAAWDAATAAARDAAWAAAWDAAGEWQTERLFAYLYPDA